MAITCRCRILDVDDGAVTGTAGLDLHLIEVDERPSEVLLQHYLRWAQAC
jgi:hypothetical protein